MNYAQESTQLGVYIPMDRRQAMAAQYVASQSGMPAATGLPTDPGLSVQAEGAVLFADISGFTPLALALSSHLGPQRGAEQLTHQLNQVYEVLITQIHRYRGSVIGFVGDAITCWFPDDNGRRATTCALAMQTVMAPFSQECVADEVGASFSIKIGIATGRVRRFRVGNPDIQYIDVLAGAPLRTMSLAEGLARKGEVILSADTVTALGDSLTIAEWRSPSLHADTNDYALITAFSSPVAPNPWPDLPPHALPFDGAYPWVLPTAYERLQGAKGQFMAELRPAVSLFLRFSGLDYDVDPQAGQKLDRYIQWVQHVARQYNGSLIQLTIGDKGSFLYVAFGAPLSYDNDAVYAVLAALELIAPPEELDFIQSSQIGIALGVARTGAYGSPARRSYGVIGDDVVLAARLMGVAPPGEIRCSHSVYRQTRQYIAFEDLRPVRVKGRVELVRVYRPLSDDRYTSHIADQSHALVGRQVEIARLTECFEAVLAGNSRIALVEGEAGIGKSRLISEVTHLIRERGLTYLFGAGQSLAQQTPYRAWRDVFSFYFGLNGVSDIEQRRQQLRVVIQQMLPELAPYVSLLNDVLSFGLSESAKTLTLDPQLRKYYLTQLLIGLLHAWAKSHPVLLIFEDVHWLDRLSWELIAQVVHSLATLPAAFFLLLVTRPLAAHSVGAQQIANLQDFVTAFALQEEAAAEQAAFADASQREGVQPAATLQMYRFSLSLLDSQEIVALVADRLGIPLEHFPASLMNLLETRAGGNPFFAEELALALREQDIIQRPSGPEQIAYIVNMDLLQEWQALPYTIHGLILSRIDHLSLEQQFTLKVASVIGQVFDFALLMLTLEQHTGVARAELQLHLDILVALDLIVVQSIEPAVYAFKHNLMQEAVYQTLLFAQRRALHRTVAETLEVLYVTRLESQVEILAHHWLHADVLEKAIPYWVQTGERARRAYANEDAIAHFRKTLALLDKAELADTARWRFRVWHGLGRTYFALAEMSKTEACLRQAIALADVLHLDIEVLARLYYDLGEALWWQNRTAEHVKVGQEAVALLGDEQESVAAALAYQTLAAGYVSQGNGEKFYEITYRTAKFLRQLPYSEELRSAFVHVIVAYQSQHKVQETYQWLNALEVHATQHHDLRASAEVHYLSGNFLLDQGRLREAARRHQQALVLYIQVKDVKFQSWCLKGLARAYLSLGGLQNAAMYATRALETAKVVGDNRYVIAEHQSLVGVVALCAGDVIRAHNTFEKAYRLFHILKSFTGEAQSLYNMGYAALARGMPDVALQYFQGAASFEIPSDKWGICMPHFLSALELAYGKNRTDEFHAFCERIVAQYTTQPQCSLSQWFLEPAAPDTAFLLNTMAFSDLYEQLNVGVWQWEDPLDDCQLVIDKNIVIHATNGRGLLGTNRSAPRLWCMRSGDYVLQVTALPTTVPSMDSDDFTGLPALGGLILWHNRDNYVCLDWGSFGPQEIRLIMVIGNEAHTIGRGWLPQNDVSQGVVLRLERRGSQVRALCRLDSADAPWWQVGEAQFPVANAAQVGLYAVGDLNRVLYPGAFPNGTAIQFTALSFTV